MLDAFFNEIDCRLTVPQRLAINIETFAKRIWHYSQGTDCTKINIKNCKKQHFFHRVLTFSSSDTIIRLYFLRNP